MSNILGGTAVAALSDRDLTHLLSVIEREVETNPEIHKALTARVQAAYKSLQSASEKGLGRFGDHKVAMPVMLD